MGRHPRTHPQAEPRAPDPAPPPVSYWEPRSRNQGLHFPPWREIWALWQMPRVGVSVEKPPVSPTLRLLSQEHRGGTQITDPSSSMGRKPSPLAPSPAKRLLHTSQLPAEQASSWPLATVAAPPRTRSHTILTPQGWKGPTWSWGNQGPGCVKVALSVFGPVPSGVWSRWGWQGPQRTGTPRSGLGTSFKGMEAPWNQAQDRRAGEGGHTRQTALCAQRSKVGTRRARPHQELPRGPPRGRPRPGGELPGQAHPTLMGLEGWHGAGGHCRQEGRGQGGRRGRPIC